MVLKSYLIGPAEEGEQNNIEPFYLPEDAYVEMEEAYVWRGRIRKRFGSSLIGSNDLNSRLRINVGTTNGGGDLTVVVPGNIFKKGQMFSIGSDVFTVSQLTQFSISNITKANPGEVTTASAHGYDNGDKIFIYDVQGMTQVNLTSYTITSTGATTFTLGIDTTAFGAYTGGGFSIKALAMLSTGAGSGTYNGEAVITGASTTTVCYFYPAEPVMGLRTRETTNINAELVIAFDTQFSYRRSGGGWEILGAVPPAAGSAIWTGSDSSFFWSSNYRGANLYETFFYVVNNTAADNIKYLPSGSTTWTNFRPQFNSAGNNRFLETCRILLPFKDRLVALNTVEDENGTDRTYPNRCRFSQNGDPRAPATSWIDDTSGRGGFIDAPTQEQIVTAEYIKDRLIVYFERSTWELVYTGNTSVPFRWEQINNQLGSESTFSVLGFDTSVLGVGNVGIHTCNGVNVGRIDEKIPDKVFKVHNGNSGPERVYGIRDYFNEIVYWAFPAAIGDPTYPTRVLLYNYRNHTWAVFTDSFTCFGYHQKTSDLRWDTVGETYPSWEKWNNPWGSPLFQSSFPDIIGGNQEGFVMTINNGLSSNSQSLSITDMTAATNSLTVVDHNLREEDYVLVEESQGITSLNDTIFQVQEVVDSNTLILDITFTGTYKGGGKLSRVSNINILSKQFNPGTPVGQQFRIPYVDFLLNRTTNGEISVNYLIDTSSGQAIQDQVSSTTLLGNNTLFTRPEDNQTFQINQQQIWHRYYLQSQGQFIQFLFFMDDTQMRDASISQADFELHGILIYAEPQGRLIG